MAWQAINNDNGIGMKWNELCCAMLCEYKAIDHFVMLQNPKKTSPFFVYYPTFTVIRIKSWTESVLVHQEEIFLAWLHMFILCFPFNFKKSNQGKENLSSKIKIIIKYSGLVFFFLHLLFAFYLKTNRYKRQLVFCVSSEKKPLYVSQESNADDQKVYIFLKASKGRCAWAVIRVGSRFFLLEKMVSACLSKIKFLKKNYKEKYPKKDRLIQFIIPKKYS